MRVKALEARLKRLVRRDPLLRAAGAASRETGVPLWLVGGLVRDAALGRRAQDLDLVAGKGARRLVRALESVWARRLFRFRKRGVTTWRTTVAGRSVDVVDASRRGLSGDLERRELTINAVAFEITRGRLIDPLGGLGDLRAGKLRLPRAGVLAEDPVRVLRLTRFLATIPGARLSPAAKREALAAAPRLRRASAERIRDEIDRLLCSAAPALGLAAMTELGLLEPAVPELVPLRTCPAGEGRPDAWAHTLRALALAARPGHLPGAAAARDPEGARVLRWAVLLHDIAKPETFRRAGDGRPTFHGHEVIGSRAAERLLRRLRAPGALRRRVSRMVLFHLRPHHLADAGAPERGLRRLVREAGPDLPLLVLHAACDAQASGAPDAAARWRRLRPLLLALLRTHRDSLISPLPRLVAGDDVMRALGLAPGPEVGRVLRELRELQEQGTIETREQALRYLASRPAAV